MYLYLHELATLINAHTTFDSQNHEPIRSSIHNHPPTSKLNITIRRCLNWRTCPCRNINPFMKLFFTLMDASAIRNQIEYTHKRAKWTALICTNLDTDQYLICTNFFSTPLFLSYIKFVGH